MFQRSVKENLKKFTVSLIKLTPAGIGQEVFICFVTAYQGSNSDFMTRQKSGMYRFNSETCHWPRSCFSVVIVIVQGRFTSFLILKSPAKLLNYQYCIKFEKIFILFTIHKKALILIHKLQGGKVKNSSAIGFNAIFIVTIDIWHNLQLNQARKRKTQKGKRCEMFV